ncbi:MAG: SIS domain-containing protein [Chitinispirillales bacterium]|jgi:phosphoheptose isomerase|nr:SIS domain-containing protein [Chitinispirillales bacterium]
MKAVTQKIFNELFENYPILQGCKENIGEFFDLGIKAYKNDKTILVCGNGGSAADCEHIVGELMKGFMQKRTLPENENQKFINAGFGEISNKLQRAIPAISLVSQTGIITACANDIDQSMVFAQQVFAYKNIAGLLVAVSTSGNSQNALEAVKIAKFLGIKSVGLLGNDGGEIAKLADCSVIVSENKTHKIQELHLPVYHAWCAMLEAELF